jgi:hypothetical protein
VVFLNPSRHAGKIFEINPWPLPCSLQFIIHLWRPRRRWEDNIKMDLREIGFGDVDWIHLAQDRDRWRALVSMLMNLRVP